MNAAESKTLLGSLGSFEQGALRALAAMTSVRASYVARPGDYFFQSHGVSPCVSVPPRAVLPLVVHYYGSKHAITELDAIGTFLNGKWQLTLQLTVTLGLALPGRMAPGRQRAC